MPRPPKTPATPGRPPRSRAPASAPRPPRRRRGAPAVSTTAKPGEIRLQKFLSGAGIASRRQAETLITAGRVSINGKAATELGVRVDPKNDRVTVDGEPVRLPAEPMVVLMNKPREMVCTESDPEGRARIHELLPKGLPRLFTIGRLDYHTEGVLLLTTDGDLARALTSPDVSVPRVYHVKLNGPPDPRLTERFSRGVRLADGTRFRPSDIEVLSETRTNTWYEIVLTEGKNRQIHRMCEASGKRVLKLKRMSYGPIRLDDLPTGASRPLSKAEIASLREAAGQVGPGSTAGLIDEIE